MDQAIKINFHTRSSSNDLDGKIHKVHFQLEYSGI